MPSSTSLARSPMAAQATPKKIERRRSAGSRSNTAALLVPGSVRVPRRPTGGQLHGVGLFACLNHRNRRAHDAVESTAMDLGRRIAVGTIALRRRHRAAMWRQHADGFHAPAGVFHVVDEKFGPAEAAMPPMPVSRKGHLCRARGPA